MPFIIAKGLRYPTSGHREIIVQTSSSQVHKQNSLKKFSAMITRLRFPEGKSLLLSRYLQLYLGATRETSIE
jgi:hypothetical protein